MQRFEGRSEELVDVRACDNVESSASRFGSWLYKKDITGVEKTQRKIMTRLLVICKPVRIELKMSFFPAQSLVFLP